MPDHEHSILGKLLAVDALLFGLGPLKIGNGGQNQSEHELSRVSFSQSAHRSMATDLPGIRRAEHLLERSVPQLRHLSTVAPSVRTYISMQSKKFTKAVIWFVVIAMVLSLIVAAAAAII